MHEYFKELVEEMDRIEWNDPLPTKGVTVRLDYLAIAHIDQLAEEMGKPRQWVLETLLETAIPAAFRGLIEARGETVEERRKLFYNINEDVKERAVSIAADEEVNLEIKGFVLRTGFESMEEIPTEYGFVDPKDKMKVTVSEGRPLK